jgi:hypothetical protein
MTNESIFYVIGLILGGILGYWVRELFYRRKRCAKCKHVVWLEDYPGSYYPYCTYLCKETREDDFCSYGERKDGAEDG